MLLVLSILVIVLAASFCCWARCRRAGVRRIEWGYRGRSRLFGRRGRGRRERVALRIVCRRVLYRVCRRHGGISSHERISAQPGRVGRLQYLHGQRRDGRHSGQSGSTAGVGGILRVATGRIEPIHQGTPSSARFARPDGSAHARHLRCELDVAAPSIGAPQPGGPQ